MNLATIWHSPLVHGALTGILAAAAVDYRNFTTWKSYHDALAYSWGIAFWRWFQGGIAGLVGAAGLWAVGA